MTVDSDMVDGTDLVERRPLQPGLALNDRTYSCRQTAQDMSHFGWDKTVERAAGAKHARERVPSAGSMKSAASWLSPNESHRVRFSKVHQMLCSLEMKADRHIPIRELC